MTIPSQTFGFPDGNLGATGSQGNVGVFIGNCSGALTDNTVYSFGTKSAAEKALVSGPMAEDVGYVTQQAGGQVLCIRPTLSVAAVTGAVTKTAAGSGTGALAFTGTPADDQDFQAVITVAGTLGAARFKYSLDGGKTWSGELVIPSGGTYAVPSAGISLVFTAGAGPTFFVVGDTFKATHRAAFFTATDLATAIDALRASGYYFDFIVLSGAPATASAGAAIFSAFDGKLTELANALKPCGGIMHVGHDTAANVRTAFLSLTSKRIAHCADFGRLQSGLNIIGNAAPLAPTSRIVAMRACAMRFSRDLAKNLGDGATGGPIPGLTELSRDENATPELDDLNIATLRTVPGLETDGYFLTNAWLGSPSGSDYRYWQHRRVVDKVHRIVAQEQARLQGSDFRVKNDGTGALDDADADFVEQRIQALIDATFFKGSLPDASAIRYGVDRTHNVLSTETIVSETEIVPLAVVKNFDSTIAFTKRISTGV